MKKLILPLLIVSSSALAAPEFKEVSDHEIKNQFLSIVKDTEVENKLNGTSEFTTCRDQNPYNPNKPDPTILKKATDCFTQAVNGKGEAEIKKLADNLRLESFGLIKSKNVKDINEYLANKMEKALTGVDPKEKNHQKRMEQLQFKNQKMVDQSVFIELYINQLGKTALQEVSRFCFENLRNKKNKSINTFYEHWTNGETAPNFGLPGISPITNAREISGLTDDGNPQFEIGNAAGSTDKEKVFNEMLKGISSNPQIDSEFMTIFFGVCQSSIKPLCDEFKRDKNSKLKDENLNIAQTQMEIGANACLTMGHLQSVRMAISKSKTLLESMNKLSQEDQKTAITLTLQEPVKMYSNGKGEKGEQTLDELTSSSSTDFLENQDEAYQKNLDECMANGEASGCEDSIGKKENFDKALVNIEMESNLKREIEIARIKAMGDDKKKFEEYLKENGYFDLINKGTFKEEDIIDAIKNNFNAKRVAMIQALNKKVGSRQLPESATKAEKKSTAEDMAKASKNERARLAQVVLFNNIITSHLELKNQKNEVISKNVNAWKKEQAALDANSNYNKAYFQQVSQMVDNEKDNSSKLQDTSIIDVGIIDTILGAKDENKP